MYSEIAANKRKTVFLLVLFVLFIGLLGWVFSQVYGGGKPSITIGVLIGAAVYALFSYLLSSRAALALNGAEPLTKRQAPRLYRIVENIAITNGLPMPKVYIIDDPALNAFATGRNPNTASVTVTSGLMEILTDSELEGVVAHEMGHVKNYDIRVSMVAFAMVAVVSIVADIMLRLSWFGGSRDDDNNNNQLFFFLSIIAAILAPIIALLIQLAISRRREYLADATGALTTRYPEGLAGALEKIRDNGSTMKRQNTSTAHLFIANPLSKRSFASLLSTHPPIEERIAKLRNMNVKA